MRLSFSALKRYLDFSGSVEEAANLLADLGFPNDGIEKKGAALSQVIVGRIESQTQHPQADRLSLLKVNVGSQILSVVCGAKNMKPGDHVALAPVGAHIPGKDGKGMTMERAKIRGEVSEGMCCSRAELGLVGDSEGIWILESERVAQSLGQSLSSVYSELTDAVILVDVTPNRGDALCVRGLARELAAKLGLKLKSQKTGRWKTPGASVKPSIENLEECYGFLACAVEGVKLSDSPEEWKRFLEACGSRSINNLVDATNVVLFEYGHPIHFFDAEKVDGQTLCVRFARAGEKLTLLDGKEVSLHLEDLVIADQHQVLSLAGVMGGLHSSVSESTKSLIIEVASFSPRRIRASAKRHGLSSESSHRFERGVTPYRLEETLERALGLLQECGGFELASGSKVVSRQLQRASCLWDRKRVEKKIGRLELSDNQIFDRLRALEYEFDPRGSSSQISFPWYRTDGDRIEDVMEDVARLLGYENLEKTAWVSEESVKTTEDLRGALKSGDELLNRFVSLGFCQSIHWSFTRPELEALFALDSGRVRLSNPIHAEKSDLRQSLIPQLLECAQMNAAHNEEDIRLVEMGPVFSESGYSDYSQSPKVEEWRLAVLWMPRSIDTKRPWAGKEDLFFDFKGMCESALGSFAGRPQKFLEKCFHPKRMWKSSGGIAGELHPSILKKLDISGRVFAGEWSLKIHERAWKFQAPAVLPTVDLDVCFEVQQSVALAEIEALIEKKKNSWLESFRAYDVFEDEKILGAGKRAITFALRYRDAQRTLSLEEVKQEHEKLVKVVIEGLGSHRASLR